MLGGQYPAVIATAYPANENLEPGITISPAHSGIFYEDPDDLATELNKLIANHDPLEQHLAKTQQSEAARRVLILRPDSTWGAAWRLEPGGMGSGPMPTTTLSIKDQTPLEVWIIGWNGLVWVYKHPSGDWTQHGDTPN